MTMLRVFRNNRKALLNAKKIRKYGAYAIGEIILVVIGILIALQFNNADLDRQDRTREKAFMISMLGDLEKDVRELSAAIEGNQILLDGLDALLRQIALRPLGDAEQRQLFLLSLKNTYWYLTAEFAEGTLAQLKYSGGFQLIQDSDVMDAILNYDQGMDRCKHQYEEMVNYFHAVEARQKNLFNFSLGKRAYEFIEQDFMNILLPPERFEELIDEGTYLTDAGTETRQVYYGDVLFYRTAISNTNWFMGRQKELALSLSLLIRENYDIQ